MSKDFDIAKCSLKADKSGTIPSAQNTTQCAPGGCKLTTEATKNAVIHDMSVRNATFFMIYSIMSECGLRVSECLAIKHNNISESGHFKVVGKKGSKSGVYYCSEAAGYLKRCREKCVHPWQGISRFQVYRLFRAYGLSYTFKDNIRASVTHLPRHAYALEVKSIEGDENMVSEALRHRSVSNRKFYDKEK
jgi:site-specific recombinase XerD